MAPSTPGFPKIQDLTKDKIELSNLRVSDFFIHSVSIVCICLCAES